MGTNRKPPSHAHTTCPVPFPLPAAAAAVSPKASLTPLTAHAAVRPPPIRNPKPEDTLHAAATEGAECESASAGGLASAARAELPRDAPPRLPLSRSEAPVPLASFETPVCLLCLVQSDRLLHWRQRWICCLFNLAFFFLFVGTIRAVWDRRSCSFRSPRSPVIRWFCGGKLTSVSVCGEQNFGRRGRNVA